MIDRHPAEGKQTLGDHASSLSYDHSVHHEPDTISRRGGAIVNGLRLTWPLVSLTVTPASLRVATLFGARYELRREEIARLTLKWRHLWPGIQIEHTRTDLPHDLFFLALYRPTLVRQLSRMGYTVI